MKQFEWIQISEEQKKEIYWYIEWIVDMPYDTFESIRRSNWMWLWNKFLLFWVLKYRKDPKALELWNKLDIWHRQTKRDEVKKINEEIKLQEILKNKNRFVNDCKVALDDENKKLKIIKEIDCSLGKTVVIGCTYYWQNYESKYWWTTAVYERITPWLYMDIIRTYPRMN